VKLVLLDVDGVLAMGPDGEDCGDGQEIYRTSLGPLVPPAPPDTRVVVLTHRQRGEANQIISALDLREQVHGVVCADDMMRQWFRSLLRGRVMPGLTKDLCAPILVRRFGWDGPHATAFIDDSPFNLQRIRAAGLARHCIHLRRPQVAGRQVQLAAVAEAVSLAYRLIATDDVSTAAQDIIAMEWRREPSDLAQLATGVILRVRRTPASRLRASLAAVRKWVENGPFGRPPAAS
jgi:hypothetical protein